jgi:hypothetical protein
MAGRSRRDGKPYYTGCAEDSKFLSNEMATGMYFFFPYLNHTVLTIGRIQIKETYLVVNELAEQSGFSWSTEDGAAIDAASQTVWIDYISVSPAVNCYQRDMTDQQSIRNTPRPPLFATRDGYTTTASNRSCPAS